MSNHREGPDYNEPLGGDAKPYIGICTVCGGITNNKANVCSKKCLDEFNLIHELSFDARTRYLNASAPMMLLTLKHCLEILNALGPVIKVLGDKQFMQWMDITTSIKDVINQAERKR